MSNDLLNFVTIKLNKRFRFNLCKRLGKNFSGKISVFHRGGGVARFIRVVDFFRRVNSYGTICLTTYDPSRSAYIGLILYDNSFFSYIALSEGLAEGRKVYSGFDIVEEPQYLLGSSFRLKVMGLFSVVSYIESRPKFGAAIARAAGAGALLITATSKTITLKLRSG